MFLLGLLCIGLASADTSLTYPLSGFEHHFTNRAGVFAKHSMLGLLVFNDESVRYAAESSDPDFCRNVTLSSETILAQFLANSGKSPNDLGFYDDCKYLSESKNLTQYSQPQYSLIKLSYMGGQFKWGMCYPAVCYKTLNQTIYQAATLLGFEIQSDQPDTFQPFLQTQYLTIIMLVIMGLLILLAIVGTIIQHMSYGKASSPITEKDPMYHNSSTHPLEHKEGCFKFLTCFSFSLNIPRLLTRQRASSPTDVLDGVRVLSIFWVILGHSYFFTFNISANNLINAYFSYPSQFFFTLVTQGVLAVDTFFFLSGFLAAYILLSKLPAGKCQIEVVPFLYFRRFYRLTPLLGFIMYFSAFVIYPLASGPMRSDVYNFNIENCKNYGWSTLLYLNNYYPQRLDQICFAWTWYLAIDMHLFLLLPFYVILYKLSSVVGYIAIALTLAANFAVSFAIAWEHKLGVGLTQQPMTDDFNYFQDYYAKIYIRCSTYVVGILFAILYYNYRKIQKQTQYEQLEEEGSIPHLQIKRNCGYSLFICATRSTKAAWAYLLSGFLLTFLCVFLTFWPSKSQDPQYWSLTARTLFNTLERPLFVTGVALVLIPLLSGRFTYLRMFLGNEVFVVLSRFTYSVYLIHQVILLVFLESSKATVYFTHLEGIVIALSMIVLSYIFGGVATLLVESPLSNIDKHILFKERH